MSVPRRFDHSEAARLYETGWSGPKLALRFSVTHKAIYDALDKIGVERRPRVATSVRATELQCSTCREWNPDDSFPSAKNNVARRGRHRQCRKCGTEARQDYRQHHRIPCDRCGALRLPQSEKNGGLRRHRIRDTGLCLTCYVASIRKAA